MTRPARVISLVSGSVAQHAYIRMLHQALAAAGMHVEPRESLTLREIRVLAAERAIVHLHWPDFLGYHSQRPWIGPAVSHVLAARTLAQLTALRRSRVTFVWTVHDLLPHDARFPRLDQQVFAAAARADGVLVHSEYAASRVRAQFGRVGQIKVAPHPNFDGYYPEPRTSRAALRAELGIRDAERVYLMFGHLRPYKQVVEAIRDFRELSLPATRLLVVGSPSDPGYAQAVEAARGDDDRVVLRLGFVPDDLVAAYHHASDIAVFNHREVFTSGALMLALTFGLPVVAPSGGTTSEVVGPPAAELFDPGQLGLALNRIRTGAVAERRAAARAAGAACSWDRMTQALLSLYGA